MNNSILIICISFLIISGCGYNKPMRSTEFGNPVITSSDITLKRKEKMDDFSFVVKYYPNKQAYFLVLSYIGDQYKSQLNKNTELKFLINNSYIMSLMPITDSKIIAYIIDPVEAAKYEINYSITESQLYDITYANDVSVQLICIDKILSGEFTYLFSFDPLKKFMKQLVY